MNIEKLPLVLRKFMPKNTLDIVLYGVFVLAVLKLIGLYRGINEDNEGNWNEFKVEHHCQLKSSGESSVPSTWECDDGKTYYRWRQVKS
jgi:hypothetical protein